MGAAIGAFIGFILGDLIGSLFGHHKPRVPTASAETVLQIPLARYALGVETSANGGDLALADAMAKAARDTLNGIIAQVTGGLTTSYVSNSYSPTQVYGVNGQQIYVKLGGAYAGQTNVSSADQAVDAGVLWALPQTQIVGGDIFLKRALHNSQSPTVTALLGDLQIASDYEQYLKNEPVIDAAIASSYNSLSADDKAFYAANQAFMTRAISMTQLPLQGNDVGFYNANKAQVDRIIGSISVSSFAAGWIVTLARAAELGLGNFSPSDFYGGLAGFVQSFGVAATGATHYEDIDMAFQGGPTKIGVPYEDSSYKTTTDINGPVAQIWRLYDMALGRAPNAEEEHFWTWYMQQGNTFAQAAAYILTDAGVNARMNAPSNEEFIRQMYRFSLHREATAGEVNDWMAGAFGTGASRGDVLAFFTEYSEHRAFTDGTIAQGVGYTETAGQRLFSLLPQAAVDGRSIVIPDLASVGLTPVSPSAMTGGNDFVDWRAQPSTISLDAGGGDDVVIGSAGDDTIAGGTGFDWLDGGPGNDTLSGGDGNDVLLGRGGDDYMVGNNGDDYLAGGAGNDLIGGDAGNDTLVGGDGSDSLHGGAGNDTLIVDQDGGGTYDVLDGGSGSDTASFERFTTGVTIDISGQSAGNRSVRAASTKYFGPGSAIISPDTGYRLIFQSDGNLVLYNPSSQAMWSSGTSGQGAYAVMQGDGNLVVYKSNGQAAWASGTAGHAEAYLLLDDAGLLTINDAYDNVVWQQGGGGSVADSASFNYGDQWISIENITGSNYNDNLTGTNYGSVLKGLAGDDVLNGGAGDDTLEGGAGADQLNGGGGSNTASYVASSAGVYVNLATATAIGGDATGDTFNAIQNLTGSASGDELAGDGNANVIKAGAGDDWIDASFGTDALDGGDGYDTVDYSAMSLVSGTQEVWYDDGEGNSYSYETTDPALAITLTSTGNYATLRGGDGSKVTQTITSIEQIIGSSSDDSFSSAGTSITVTWDGGAGNDTFSGGSGSDTYVFGHNYGTYSISDSNAASNVVKLKSDVTFDDLWSYNDNGTLRIGIRGESGSVNVYNDFQGSNDVIKTLDLGGAAQVDLTQLQGGMNFGDGDDYIQGNANISQIIFGNGGNDTILAAGGNYSTKSFIVAGGLGNDYITSSVGDDQFLFERGDGSDTIEDAGGDNTIVFGPTVGADDVIYEVNGNDLYVGVKDLNDASLTASQVGDHLRIVNGGILYTRTSDGSTFWSTRFSVQAGGATTDLTKANIAWTQQTYYDGDGSGDGPSGGDPRDWQPIVLDLDGTGLQVTPVAQSSFVTKDAAGNLLRTSWVGPTNGILAFDRNGDGSINNTGDLSFRSDKAGAKTDLEGLAGWDSNGDGILDARDANFSKLLIWVDANQDGVVEAGEARSLAQAGIASIALTPKPTGFDGSDTLDTVVHNTTTFTRSDGSTGTGYDVGFARQLLSGAAPQSKAEALLGTGAATLGKLVSDPFEASTTAAKGATAVKTDATSLASPAATPVVDTVGSNASISAVDAARWADYLDPSRIQAVKDAIAGTNGGGAALGAIISTKARLDGNAALTGRGVRDAVSRLQAVIVDFDQNGPDMIAPNASNALVDVAHTGSVAQIGWVGAGNGILAYDRNGNGQVDTSTEISFLADQPNARNDFQGLAAFDTNRDGALTTADTSFANFLIWRDLNGNGISDAGEVQTLGQAGIAELDLNSAVSRSGFGSAAANEVLGVGKVVFADGSARATFDLALGFADQASSESASSDAAPAKPIEPSVPVVKTTTAPVSPAQGLQASAAPSTSPGTSASGVGLSRGSLDGPDGLVVTSDASARTGSLEWWRDPAVVGTALAGLSSPQLAQVSTLASSRLGSSGSGNTDAATLQRLMLLRQSMATLDSAGAAPAAVWNRDVAGDASLLAASARIRLAQPSQPLGRAA